MGQGRSETGLTGFFGGLTRFNLVNPDLILSILSLYSLDPSWTVQKTNSKKILGRREFNALTGITITSLALGSACRRFGGAVMPSDGRLTARPRAGVKTAATGQIKLERDAVLQIPQNSSQSSLPLLIMLHGATQRADDMFWYLGSAHEEAGVAVLAPNSLDTTWDAIGGSTFGEDIYYLDRMLERVFETTAIDPARVSVGGFSDGATYGLSLGLINGDFFKSIRRLLTWIL